MRIAALQVGSSSQGTKDTLRRIMAHEAEITRSGAKLVVMPEALLGGYPKGADFGARIGFRTPDGRGAYRAYRDQAISIPGPETEALAGLAARTGSSLVVGAIERDGYTLYCTALFFDPENGLVARHRKLMPTGSERLVWGLGDGSTLPVIETAAGRIGAAICWENYMPLLRTAMIAKGVEIWCAPTVDARDIWQISMRHIAYEGRCFLVSACQYQPSPAELGVVVEGWASDSPLIRGGSIIVSPMGEIIAGPLFEAEGLVTADIDLGAIAEARYDLDIVGHYARPDVFSLRVDERPKPAVSFQGTPPAVSLFQEPTRPLGERAQ